MNKELLLYIYALKNSGRSWEDIFNKVSKEYGIDNANPDALRKSYDNYKYQLDFTTEEINPISYQSYEEAYKELCGYIGKKKEIKQPVKKKGKRTKILSISDPHIPFHNKKLIQQIVEENKDADICLIPGDLLDCYSVSRFTKRLDMPLKEEITQCTAFIDWLAGIFPEIIILEGNHTDRVRKYFEQRVDHSTMFLVQYDLLKMICSPYKNVKVIRDSYVFPNDNGEAEIGHFTVVGKDLVVGHFEKSSSVPIKAAINAYLWIQAWSDIFGIKNIRMFLQGHTHRLSKTPLNSGTPVICESGTLAKVQDYAIEAAGKYSSHLNGYWIIYQDEGVTDINNSNFFICEIK